MACMHRHVRGYGVDVSGYGVDVWGYGVDVWGSGVDVRGYVVHATMLSASATIEVVI